MFKILTIDGGGVRGIYPAHILKRIEEEISGDIYEHFDLVVGTSTGSIVASAVAVGHSMDDVVQLYKKYADRIFKKRHSGIFNSRYGEKDLRELLELVLGSKTLSDTKTRLIINATDLHSGSVHVFKSNYLDEFVRDKNIEIVDAIMSSSAAPTFFRPNHIQKGQYLLADGGLWANNPSMVGYVEAVGKLNQNPEGVMILSIGTGFNPVQYDMSKKWGLLTGWKHKKLLSLAMNLQSQVSTNQVGLLLGERYLRLNHQTSEELSLDSVEALPQMESWADKTFTHQVEEIRKFLEGGK